MTKAEKTKQFIVEQSAVLFNTKGVAGTAMSDVMEATKMAKGGLYGHFDSKEDLAHAVVDYNLDQLTKALDKAIGKADTAKEKLFAFLDVFKSPMQFPVAGGCPILNFGTEADDTNPVIKSKVRTIIECAQSRAAEIIKNGIKNGELKDTFNAKEFSVLMLTVIEGGTLIGRMLNTNSQMTMLIKMLKKQIEEYVV